MKNTSKNVKFHDETLELFLKTLTSIMTQVAQQVVRTELKLYTENVLNPSLEELRVDLEEKISSSTTTTVTE